MAQHRHRGETRLARAIRTRPRARTVAAPLAVAATAGAVTLGLTLSGPSAGTLDASGTPGSARPVDLDAVLGAALSSSGASSAAAEDPADSRLASLSRSAVRGGFRGGSATPKASARTKVTPAERLVRPAEVVTALRRAITGTDSARWSTTTLNLWDAPGDDATQVGELDPGTRVLSTGRSFAGRDEIALGKHASVTRWVTSGYLSESKPVAAAAGLSMAPCPDSSVEYRLTPGAVYVYRSVCHAFPQITTYGGYDAHGEHASGKALDIMTSDPATLTAIGDFLREHAAELDLYDVIRMQHIWTPVRSAEGWRAMPDRGSITANHYDHVHVSVN